FANALSIAMNLQPAYEGDGNEALLVEGASGFRYPLEAEWEWAALCGEDYVYSGSDILNDVGWYAANSDAETHPVGEKQENGCGLKDMSGNVWEWVADDYDQPGRYRPGALQRANRGGSWYDEAMNHQVSSRYGDLPDFRANLLGLRLARPLIE
ncbi:MAG: SUMF1/EgtB/PvdO family nonheme iron enzyme, partial [Myxococcota bacterium]|nr:SUMF1/EgtB/PvdO family nonheme iron enzyme [Myxococcota bacterium]